MSPALSPYLRPSVFKGMVVLWLVLVGFTALPRLFLTSIPEQFARAKLALAEDPTPSLVQSIGISADMVRIIERQAIGAGLLALYGPQQEQALALQTFRCRQFFFPRKVVGWQSSAEIGAYLKAEGSILVLDYSASTDHPFAEDFDLVSEFGVLRMWSRKGAN